jgi:nucleoside-diphosphate-sugar epimerase
MSKVLMIGGNGFLGKTIKRLEIFKDHEITTLTSGGIFERNLEIGLNTVETFDGFTPHFDVILNVAQSRGGVNQDARRESNFQGPLSAISKMADSSTLIINFSTYIQFYEIPATSRQFEYQQSKKQLSEEIDLISRGRGSRRVDLALFTVYGEDDSPKSMMHQFLRELAGGSKFALSPGNQLVSWTYANDVARAIELILADKSISGNYRLWPEPPQRLRDSFEYLVRRYNSQMILDWSVHNYSGHELFQYDANIFPVQFDNFEFTEFDAGIEFIMQNLYLED